MNLKLKARSYKFKIRDTSISIDNKNGEMSISLPDSHNAKELIEMEVIDLNSREVIEMEITGLNTSSLLENDALSKMKRFLEEQRK